MIRSNIRRRKSQKSQINGAPSYGGGSFGGGSGNGESGIPYIYNSAGDYVIDKSLHSYGDVVAHSDGGIDGSLTTTYLNDLGDVDLTGKQNGYVLTYNGVSTKWEPKLPTSGGGITEVHFSDIKGNVTDNVSIKLALDNKSNINHTHTFEQLTSKPTTLAGYGITDASASNHTHNFGQITSFSGAWSSGAAPIRLCYADRLTSGQGFISRVAIGMKQVDNAFDSALISVGTNDLGTEWYDFEFTANGEMKANYLTSKGMYLVNNYNSGYGNAIKFQNEGYAHFTLGQKGSEIVIADTGANGNTFWTNPHDLFTINLAGDGKFNGDVVAYGIPTAVYSTKRSVTTLEEPVITDSPSAIDILIEKCERLERHNQYLTDEIINLKQTLK